MLPPENRLRRAQEFRSTIRHGVRAGRPLVVIHVIPGSGSDGAPVRAGFVVGGAVGGAVVRNAVRRRLRHLLRDRLDGFPPGSRVVIRAQAEAAHTPSPVLARDLDQAITRALARAGNRS